MIEINKSPVLTSKHYGINHFVIDDDVIIEKINLLQKNQVIISDADNVKIDELKIYPQNNLSKEIDVFVKDGSNFAKEITISKTSESPFEIKFSPTQNLADTILLTINENVSAKVIFKYLSNEKLYHYTTLKIILKHGALLDFAELLAISNSNNFISIEIISDTNSQINFHAIDINSQTLVQNIKFVQVGDFSSATLNSIYLSNKQSQTSLNYLFEVFGKNCNSKISASGVLNDFACKNFIGTIDFKKGSTGSIGDEDEFCLVLSKHCKSKSTPILLCHEEDVDGKHSTSTGKVDEDDLFYVMSRGIERQQAVKLLIEAKLKKQIEIIFDESFRTEVLKMIENWLTKENN